MTTTLPEYGRRRDAVRLQNHRFGGRVRERYYGRGMGNTCCLGITCDSPKTAQKMAARAGIRGASVDNMGLHYIVYWRSLNTTPVEAKP